MKRRREKIVGTIVPTELLNPTPEQALDVVAKRWHSTKLRRFFRRLYLRVFPHKTLDFIEVPQSAVWRVTHCAQRRAGYKKRKETL